MTAHRTSPWPRRAWYGLGALLVLVAVLVGGGGARAADAVPAAPQNTLSGSVTIAGDGPATGAVVVALHDSLHARTTTDVNGAYSLTLGAGEWRVWVAPPSPSIASPTWVYTGEAQLISFSGNPDPITPIRRLDFVVAAATATVSGRLIDPSGGTNFAAPNRAWVRAENQEGQGNTVQVNPADGTFSVNVLPGNVLLRLALENERWAPPPTLAGTEWYVGAGEQRDAGDLDVLLKQATISGTVIDLEAGTAVPAGVPIRAWRLDGSEVEETTTGPDGSYVLRVISGTWELRAVPPVDSMFVPAQSPQRVVVRDGDHAIRALAVARANVLINGTIVDEHGAPIPGLNGRAYALYDGNGRWPQLGPSVPIVDGRFALKLSTHVATSYKIRAFFPRRTGYTALAAIPIRVAPGETRAITLPAAANNSSISGRFNNHDTGLPQTGLPGIVYAASDSGGTARDRLNPLDGSYRMEVASTTTSGHGGSFWRLRGYVDPSTGYIVQRPRWQRVFLPYNNGQGADVTADFTVARIDAAIGGRVTDAQGNPVAGAKVSADERDAPAGERFSRWTISGPDGRYLLRVTAGTYLVRADFRSLIPPQPQVMTVASGSMARADLQFRPKNALIVGQVTYNGAGHTAFVRAYSDSGAHAFTLAGPGGQYRLGVNAGDTWHVQAVSEDGTTFLQSVRTSVTTHTGVNGGVDLVLQPGAPLPDALAFAFDASEDQVLALADGAQLIIPAGALATDGPVVVTVRPRAELADDGGAQPIAFGYRVHAFDASRLPITHFNIPITIALPFTAEQLAALGITTEQLVPAYWDEATESWKPVENVSVQVDSNGDGVVFIEVAHFTDYALLAGDDHYRVFVPLLAK